LTRGLKGWKVREAFFALPPIAKLLIIMLLVNLILVASIASSQLRIFQNTAIVKSINIGVYNDVNCTSQLFGVDWGIIEPGQNKTVLAYIRNEGNWEATLSIWAANWSSSEAEQHMSFSTNYQGQLLEVGEVLPILLILSVASETQNVDSFGFDIVIEASG